MFASLVKTGLRDQNQLNGVFWQSIENGYIEYWFFVDRECVLGPDVERLSSCELEVDVVASDILNKLEIGGN